MIDDYRGGYFKAIMDIKDFFEIYETAITRCGRGNRKSCLFVRRLMESIIRNLDMFMNLGPRGTIPSVQNNGDVTINARV